LWSAKVTRRWQFFPPRSWTVFVKPAYNRVTGLAILCPVTSQIKGYPFEVLLPEGLPVLGAVLSDQVRLLDWRARKASRICRLPDEITADVLGKLQSLLARDQ
jgi:mRNA interferase MazF